MKKIEEITTFTEESLDGSGQYIVRVDEKQELRYEQEEIPYIIRTGYLSTIMYKVGYIHNSYNIGGEHKQLYCLISMSDGWTRFSHFENTKDENGKPTDPNDWVKVLWDSKQVLLDYLNSDKTNYRHATKEEVLRVINYQDWRCKGKYGIT